MTLVSTPSHLSSIIPNAAVSTYMGSFLETPEAAMDKMYEINYKGVLFLVRDAIPYMRDRKGANVILVSSLSGYEQEQMIGFYGITKTMVLVMNKLLARELQPEGIRVNCVAPGVIKTKFSELLWKDKETDTVLTQGKHDCFITSFIHYFKACPDSARLMTSRTQSPSSQVTKHLSSAV